MSRPDANPAILKNFWFWGFGIPGFFSTPATRILINWGAKPVQKLLKLDLKNSVGCKTSYISGDLGCKSWHIWFGCKTCQKLHSIQISHHEFGCKTSHYFYLLHPRFHSTTLFSLVFSSLFQFFYVWWRWQPWQNMTEQTAVLCLAGCTFLVLFWAVLFDRQVVRPVWLF